MADLTRRSFLAATAAGAAWVALGGCSSSSSDTKGTTTTTLDGGRHHLPDPKSAPFDTVVVLMLENRSFDHLLGLGARRQRQAGGLTFPDLHGRPVPTAALGNDFQACGDKDPSHDWRSMVKQYNGGKCDGWLSTQVTGDHFPISYYEHEQVPILGALATNYTLFDSYHCSLMSATWPNRFYMLCAATDVDETGSSFPTTLAERPSNIDLAIFDRVRGAGLTTGYYQWGEPMTEAVQVGPLRRHHLPDLQVLRDAKAGTLPNVTFVEPDFTTLAEFLGTSNDYHPHGNIEVGEGYLAQVYNALRNSPQWDRMVGVVNFDENGAFYDHVVPPNGRRRQRQSQPGPAPELQAARLPRAVHRHRSVRAAEDRDRGPVRALLDPQDDRMALGPRADDGPRREREELGRSARLQPRRARRSTSPRSRRRRTRSARTRASRWPEGRWPRGRELSLRRSAARCAPVLRSFPRTRRSARAKRLRRPTRRPVRFRRLAHGGIGASGWHHSATALLTANASAGRRVRPGDRRTR
jgi:phospholipase C